MFQSFPLAHLVSRASVELAQKQSLPSAITLTCAEGWGGELLARCAAELLNIRSDLPVDQVAHPDFCWVQPEGAMIKLTLRANHLRYKRRNKRCKWPIDRMRTNE